MAAVSALFFKGSKKQKAHEKVTASGAELLRTIDAAILSAAKVLSSADNHFLLGADRPDAMRPALTICLTNRGQTNTLIL